MIVKRGENILHIAAIYPVALAVEHVHIQKMRPGIDRAIRRQTRFADLPVIALTAKAMKGDREKSLEAGASDYIAKPVEIAELLALMRMWIGG